MKVLAVIPARGGSKRLPRKNIRLLGALPMLAYSIAAALEAGLFSRVLVSTDDPEIAAIARRYGAEVPFMREASLADDLTPASLVSLDCLERLAEDYDAVAQLMPNCPFRNAEDIRASFAQFRHNQPDSQLSVTSYGWLNPWWALEMNQAHQLKPLFPEALKSRSQDLPTLFCPSGAIWWAKAEALKTHKSFYTPDYSGFELAWDHALDIDDEADWLLAETLLLRKSNV